MINLKAIIYNISSTFRGYNVADFYGISIHCHQNSRLKPPLFLLLLAKKHLSMLKLSASRHVYMMSKRTTFCVFVRMVHAASGEQAGKSQGARLD